MPDATNPPDAADRAGAPGSPVPLADLLRSWVADGVISPEQAGEIRQRTDERTSVQTSAEPAAPQVTTPPPAETLGYLGGLVVAIASILITARYWGQLSDDVRIALVAGAAVVLLGAAFAAPWRPGAVGMRLRAVLLLASTVTFAGCLDLLGETSWLLRGEKLTLLVVGGTMAYAVGLWAMNRTALQQLVAEVLSIATAGVLVSVLATGDSLPGVAIWGASAVWFLFGWGGVVPNRRAVEIIAAIGTVVGSVFMLSSTGSLDAALAFGLANAAVLVALALAFRDLGLLAIGAVASVQSVVSAVSHWFPDSVVVPLALLLLGILLVGAALLTAQRRRAVVDQSAALGHDYSIGDRLPALAAAAAVTVAVAAFITVMSLH